MAYATLVFFKHDDPSRWRDHFFAISRILKEFDAYSYNYGANMPKWKYNCELIDDSELNCENAEVRAHLEGEGYKTLNLYCDDLSFLPDSLVLNVYMGYNRARVPLPKPVESTETVTSRRDASISIRYDSQLYEQYPSHIPRSPGVFSMVLDVPLDPIHSYAEVSGGKINYVEILEYYELVKRIHVEVGFSVTSGCMRDYFNVFGVTESDCYYDDLFRFDTRGMNRLNSAYEEMRDLLPSDDRRYTKDDKLLFSVVTEYDHPVPIILRDPAKRMK